jgi:hypothetical protein
MIKQIDKLDLRNTLPKCYYEIWTNTYYDSHCISMDFPNVEIHFIDKKDIGSKDFILKFKNNSNEIIKEIPINIEIPNSSLNTICELVDETLVKYIIKYRKLYKNLDKI